MERKQKARQANAAQRSESKAPTEAGHAENPAQGRALTSEAFLAANPAKRAKPLVTKPLPEAIPEVRKPASAKAQADGLPWVRHVKAGDMVTAHRESERWKKGNGIPEGVDPLWMLARAAVAVARSAHQREKAKDLLTELRKRLAAALETARALAEELAWPMTQPMPKFLANAEGGVGVLSALLERGFPVRLADDERTHETTCPAHGDNKVSLSVSHEQDGRCVLRCSAGCSPEKVLEALGLSESDLSPRETATAPASTAKDLPDTTEIVAFLGRAVVSADAAIKKMPKGGPRHSVLGVLGRGLSDAGVPDPTAVDFLVGVKLEKNDSRPKAIGRQRARGSNKR